MKGTKKAAVKIAVVLIAAGLLIGLAGLAALDFDWLALDSANYMTRTYYAKQPFDRIHIRNRTCDVRFALSEEETCRVVCRSDEKMEYRVAVEDGTLVIRETDNRKWYDYIGIHLGSPEMVVYLPEAEYEKLEITTDVGDVVLSESFSFGEVEVKTHTGDVTVRAAVEKTLKIHTNTGDISIRNVQCEKIMTECDTGDVQMTNVIAGMSIIVETSTGDVELSGCDAPDLLISTDTGDVDGTLLSKKVFVVETDTGDVDVPRSKAGGSCQVETDTGDIRFRIQ